MQCNVMISERSKVEVEQTIAGYRSLLMQVLANTALNVSCQTIFQSCGGVPVLLNQFTIRKLNPCMSILFDYQKIIPSSQGMGYCGPTQPDTKQRIYI